MFHTRQARHAIQKPTSPTYLLAGANVSHFASRLFARCAYLSREATSHRHDVLDCEAGRESPLDTDLRKAEFSALVVLSAVLEPETMEEHLKLAQQALRGWTFHSSFQFVSGKRFRAVLESTPDIKVRTLWALAHVLAKEFASSNDWSGAGRPTDADLKRYEQLAASMAEGAA